MKKLVVAFLLAMVALCAQAEVLVVWVIDSPTWKELSPMEREVVEESCRPELPVARLVYYRTNGIEAQRVLGEIRCVPARGYFVVDIICYYRDGCGQKTVEPQLAFDLEMRLRIPSLLTTLAAD